uniref:Uncharacterized protein n=1 Tax=Romanomermis culicivorax TaxID=13658 RepID=A0A915KKR1_ROMCU
EALPENQELVIAEEKREKSSKLSVEHYLGCGFYQVYHLLLSQFVTVAHASNMTIMAFGKIVPRWTCEDENWTAFNSTNFYANLTKIDTVNSCANLAKYGCEKLTMTTDYKSVVYEVKFT